MEEEKRMESVMQKIRESRKEQQEKKAAAQTTESEIVVDGCQVKMRFDTIGDRQIMTAIQSMLISAHLNSAFNSPLGGEKCEQ